IPNSFIHHSSIPHTHIVDNLDVDIDLDIGFDIGVDFGFDVYVDIYVSIGIYVVVDIDLVQFGVVIDYVVVVLRGNAGVAADFEVVDVDADIDIGVEDGVEV